MVNDLTVCRVLDLTQQACACRTIRHYVVRVLDYTLSFGANR